MYIEPNSTVKLLSGVPLDNSYRNTVVWDNATAQYNGFNAYTKYTLTNQSYQRVNQGIFRCDKPADSCYDCNYMMFQNTAYSNKWFYAFITSVEYVNNNMCKITFEIDIIQTWYNEWNFRSCFVERETTATDGIFEHTLSEGLEGDTITYKQERNIIQYKEFNTHSVDFVHIACVSEAYTGNGNISGELIDKNALLNSENWSTFRPQTIGNVFNSMGYYIFEDSSSGITQASYLIRNYTVASKKDAIQLIYTVPKYCLKGITWTSGNYISSDWNNPSGSLINISDFFPTTFTAENDNDTYGSYTPKNKKLFTYPFIFLQLSNKNGSSQILRFENFGLVNGNFYGSLVATYSYMPNASILCFPSLYAGKNLNIDEGVSLEGIQIGNYTTDTFTDWWSRERTSYIAKGVKTLMKSDFTAVSQGGYTDVNKINEAQSLANIAVDAISESLQVSQIPDSVMGNLSNFNQLYNNKDFDFSLSTQVIRPEIAKMIDDYFSMYGYKVNTVKVPTVRNRPHWTYIKTRNCVIDGSMPSDDIANIERIVDNGITFWRNISEVGDYSLDNSI